jgi:hypothetical protein
MHAMPNELRMYLLNICNALIFFNGCDNLDNSIGIAFYKQLSFMFIGKPKLTNVAYFQQQESLKPGWKIL